MDDLYYDRLRVLETAHGKVLSTQERNIAQGYFAKYPDAAAEILEHDERAAHVAGSVLNYIEGEKHILTQPEKKRKHAETLAGIGIDSGSCSKDPGSFNRR